MTTLLIATRNEHKVGEIRGILGQGFQYLTLKDFPGAPLVVEDAPTFEGNATKKAVELARWVAVTQTSLPASLLVLADDSGLEVDALGGAPGVLSARFASEDSHSGNAPDADNNAKLLRLLNSVEPTRRTARFRCVIALTPVFRPAKTNFSPVCEANEFELNTRLFQGKCEGQIGFVPRGDAGFGYDPLFIPSGKQATFAELGEAEKNLISHRSRALANLQHSL